MIRSTYAVDVGAQLRTRRRLLGLTQVEVADLAMTTQRSVSQVETGNAATLNLYAAVAEVLGLRIAAVERGSDAATDGAP